MHAELRELRALIEQRFGEYNAATDRYLVRMGALSAYLAEEYLLRPPRDPDRRRRNAT